MLINSIIIFCNGIVLLESGILIFFNDLFILSGKNTLPC